MAKDALEHGTAIASLLVGDDGDDGDDGDGFEGLAADAQLFAASVFSVTETGQQVATAESLIRALDWCLATT